MNSIQSTLFIFFVSSLLSSSSIASPTLFKLTSIPHSPPSSPPRSPSISDHQLFNLIIRRRLPPSAQVHHHSQLSKRQASPDPSSLLPRASVDSDLLNNSLASGAGTLQRSHQDLFRIVPEVTNPFLALTLIPAFVVVFGSFSAFVKEKLYIGEAILAVVFGIILGPYVSGVFDPRSWAAGHSFDELTLELTRIVIALSVFAVGVELPKAYVLRHWWSLTLLLGPAMLFGWIVSGALIYALVPALSFLESLVVAAAVTPTDPVLAASVVGKGKYAQKHVPAHLRHLLQAESGCNDGAAFPFLYLAMFILLRHETSLGATIGKWFLLVVLYQIALGILIGSVIGILARKTLKFCKRRSMIDKESMVVMYVALALLTTGVTALAGSDDLLAAFACGAAFAWDDWFTESIEASNFSSILDLLINCATFIYVGASIPFSSWNDPSLTLVPWRLVVLGLSILIVRRLPILILMQRIIPDFKTHREAVFCGHFGPMGVGAIFIATLATSKLPTPRIPPETSLDVLALSAQSLIYLIVLFSILIHGLSIPFFTLGRNVHSRVHTMTRTWTQASGNEPSWLSRVKRVEKSTDISTEAPKLDEVLLTDPTPIPPPEHSATQLEERQPSNETQVDGTNPIDDSNLVQKEQQVLDQPTPASTPSLSHRMMTHPAHDPTLRKLTSRVGLLRLGSSSHRTPEEQAAHRREKLIRDAWCRPERIDIVKKDEERVYKSGRQLVIERGDGDEVEVHDLPPEESHFGSSRPSDLSGREAGTSHQPGQSGATRKFDLAKLMIPRHLSKSKILSAKGSAGGMPLSGEGPRSGTNLPDQLANSSASDPLPTSTRALDQDVSVWVEGDKVVIERNDGEDVRVIPRIPSNPDELPLASFPPKIISASEATSRSDAPQTSPPSIPLRPASSRPSLSSSNPSVTEPTPSAPVESEPAEDQNDEWEEEKGDADVQDAVESPSGLYHTTPDRGRPSASQKPLVSRHSRRSKRRPSVRLSRSGSMGANRQTIPPRKSTDSIGRPPPFSRTVEFAQVKKPTPGSLADRSGSASPSRSSIRFAEQPDRSTKHGRMTYSQGSSSRSYKRKPGKNKPKLKNFVSPAVDSWRKSNLTGIMSPSLVESSRSSFLAGNGNGPSQSISRTSPSGDDNGQGGPNDPETTAPQEKDPSV